MASHRRDSNSLKESYERVKAIIFGFIGFSSGVALVSYFILKMLSLI